jgi:hypothetical protein
MNVREDHSRSTPAKVDRTRSAKKNPADREPPGQAGGPQRNRGRQIVIDGGPPASGTFLLRRFHRCQLPTLQDREKFHKVSRSKKIRIQVLQNPSLQPVRSEWLRLDCHVFMESSDSEQIGWIGVLTIRSLMWYLLAVNLGGFAPDLTDFISPCNNTCSLIQREFRAGDSPCRQPGVESPIDSISSGGFRP